MVTKIKKKRKGIGQQKTTGVAAGTRGRISDAKTGAFKRQIQTTGKDQTPVARTKGRQAATRQTPFQSNIVEKPKEQLQAETAQVKRLESKQPVPLPEGTVIPERNIPTLPEEQAPRPTGVIPQLQQGFSLSEALEFAGENAPEFIPGLGLTQEEFVGLGLSGTSAAGLGGAARTTGVPKLQTLINRAERAKVTAEINRLNEGAIKIGRLFKRNPRPLMKRAVDKKVTQALTQLGSGGRRSFVNSVTPKRLAIGIGVGLTTIGIIRTAVEVDTMIAWFGMDNVIGQAERRTRDQIFDVRSGQTDQETALRIMLEERTTAEIARDKVIQSTILNPVLRAYRNSVLEGIDANFRAIDRNIEFVGGTPEEE